MSKINIFGTLVEFNIIDQVQGTRTTTITMTNYIIITTKQYSLAMNETIVK
jgi:hypothetical protein